MRSFYWHIVFILLVCSCSIEVNQTTESTPSPSIAIASAIPALPIVPVTRVATTWADLNLTGKLIYLTSSMENGVLIASIQLLDLATGEIAILFRAPSGGWIYYASISPDGKQLVMSYEPPAQTGSSSNRALYIIPLEDSPSPQPLFAVPSPHDRYVQVEWSPDGKYIYFAHYNDNDKPDDQLNPPYDIFRMSYPNGQPEKIADRAFWPRVSSDSTKLAYISLVPNSGRNELFIANADGSNPQKVNLSGSQIPDIIDAPMFSADGQSILFSAPEPSQSYQPNWFEKVMGVQVAKAHSIPSDWWLVPVTGGLPTQITKLQTINLFASLSPDRIHVASISGDGIFVMDVDGSNLTRLLSDSSVHGTVNWIP